MSNTIHDINVIRNIILESQHLLKKSSASIEDIVSDICGLQYDPNPTIHLNQYMMLWSRKKDFKPEQLDIAAYKEFKVVETWTFKRNMFFVPGNEYSLYKKATKGIVRWGSSDESWLMDGDSPEVRAAEMKLKESLWESGGLTANEIWENLNLSFEWNKYRREHDSGYNLPIFRAFYRMCRRGDLLTCGRNPGTFREPVYILKEKVGFSDWTKDPIDEKQAIKCIVEKLIASLGVTDPVHVSHLSGYKTAEILPVFEELESEEKIAQLSYKIGRKNYYIHSSKTPLLNDREAGNSGEVRLISPMDTIVRDKTWLKTFFDYSFPFEYFKKKGMKWPLSILAGNQFVGYLDCKMDWRTRKFIVKERNIFHSDFSNYKGIDDAIEELAAFHEAKEIVEKDTISGVKSTGIVTNEGHAMEFRKPDTNDTAEITAFKQEFLEHHSGMDGTGILVRSSAEEWLLYNQQMENGDNPNGLHCLQYGLFQPEDGRLLGLLQIRLELMGYLTEFGGHIGYCVRPSERRKGYAREMLGRSLDICRKRGLKKVMITCLEDNIGSARTIESCGGLFEKTVYDGQNYMANLKRYWIRL